MWFCRIICCSSWFEYLHLLVIHNLHYNVFCFNSPTSWDILYINCFQTTNKWICCMLWIFLVIHNIMVSERSFVYSPNQSISTHLRQIGQRPHRPVLALGRLEAIQQPHDREKTAIVDVPLGVHVPSIDRPHHLIQHVLALRRLDRPHDGPIGGYVRKHAGRIVAHLSTWKVKGVVCVSLKSRCTYGLYTHLDTVRTGIEQIGEHLNEFGLHQTMAQLWHLGNIAQQAHHVAHQLLFVGEDLRSEHQ